MEPLRIARESENVVPTEASQMFNEEELKLIEGYQKGDDFIEVDCGCTNKKYGDFGGKLRVDANGRFSINCQCFIEKLTPDEFERHADKEGNRRWKYNIWIQSEGKKISILRSPLCKHYKPAANAENSTGIGCRRRQFHRDEFVRCSSCNKERRFHLRNKDECRLYHDALLKANWKCSDWTLHDITCEEDEERASRKVYRGCPRQGRCQGCPTCVCLGCYKCRYLHCSCQICTEFVQNEAA
ncbi:hypothetical protein L6164_013403 [Bauhinia variegata]|uniref:Uncharacterized protein n=1 Tax=Bauhinia variegata TaxID=167791 RepID=A0ACB9NE73_BAUVA|nr:hypothetical protein L6164_013403 [Bauhinia variegata]